MSKKIGAPDLFINGTSIASGYGLGRETAAGLARPEQYTWIHHFANKFNCNEIWNHSVPSKPIDLTIKDTIGFCTQYYEKYGSYDNLFVICELSLPTIMTDKSMRFSTNIDGKVRSIIVPAGDGNWGVDNAKGFETVFIGEIDKPDYLNSKSSFSYVPPEDINEEDLRKHKACRDQVYLTHKKHQLKTIMETTAQIDKLQQWLIERDIKFGMFWAGGTHANFHKLVDSVLNTTRAVDRMIPMKEFTCYSKGIEWSDDPFLNHPDAIGHARIADFLYDYVLKNDWLS